MSSFECSVALAISDNYSFVGIKNLPESLSIGDLPAPALIGESDEKLGDAPIGILQRSFDAIVEVGFLRETFVNERMFREYGEKVALLIGECALYPNVYKIKSLDPNSSIFDHKECVKDTNKAQRIGHITQLRNRLRNWC